MINDPEPLSTQRFPLLSTEWIVCNCIPLDLDLFDLVDYQLNRLGGQFGLRYDYADWERDLYDPHKIHWLAWQKTVDELGQELKTHNIPAYAITLPSPGNPQSGDFQEKYSRLTQEFARAGFRTTDLWPIYSKEFGSVPFKTLWALPSDMHPGRQMHAFYSREIWRVVSPEIQREKDKRLALRR